MDYAEILVPMSFFAFLTAVIIVPVIMRSRDRPRLHETLRLAYEKGQPVPPELIELLQGDARAVNGLANRYGVHRDLRRAVVLMGLALGLLAMSFALAPIGGEDSRYGLLASATIPGFIGLGYFALWYFGRDKSAGADKSDA